MKHTKIVLVCLCFSVLLMNTQCDEDIIVDEPCDQVVVVDNGFFDSAESDAYNLIFAEIQDNCLTINVSASGCDGNSWSMVLVDSGEVAESSPEQRFLKFVFSNEEICQAVFTQQRSFDLTSIQVAGSSEVILNIEDFPEPLTYIY